MDDAAPGIKAQALDFVHALFEEGVVKLDPGRIGLEFLRRHYRDASIARAKVEHFLTSLEFAELKHLFDDGLGCGIVRRELFDGFVLGAESEGEGEEGEESHQPLIYIVRGAWFDVAHARVRVLAVGGAGSGGSR